MNFPLPLEETAVAMQIRDFVERGELQHAVDLWTLYAPTRDQQLIPAIDGELVMVP